MPAARGGGPGGPKAGDVGAAGERWGNPSPQWEPRAGRGEAWRCRYVMQREDPLFLQLSGPFWTAATNWKSRGTLAGEEPLPKMRPYGHTCWGRCEQMVT